MSLLVHLQPLEELVMKGPQLYVIEYRLDSEYRTFIIRLEEMNNATAWHWASCDAGVGIIPKFGQQKVKMVSRPMAEKNGITDVHWWVSGQGAEFKPLPIDTSKFA